MPNREFLEEYPLYRKFRIDYRAMTTERDRPVVQMGGPVCYLDRPAINMDCPVCGSDQTFNMTTDIYPGLHSNDPPRGVSKVVYRCASCNEFDRFFILKFDPEGKYVMVMKVGQEPPWDISLDRTLEKILGDQAEYYKKGLICESRLSGSSQGIAHI